MRRSTCGCLTAVLGAVVAGGCNVTMESTADMRTVTQSIDVGKAESVAVSLDINAGELKVDGGSAKLMDGTFRFNVPSWEPAIDYADGAQGTLHVKQASSAVAKGNGQNEWTVRLNDTVPIDLSAALGAGEATLNLGAMNLTRVTVNQGAGEIHLDLRGAPKRSYEVHVNGGVGEAHIDLPRSVGIVAKAQGGLGEVKVSGLEKHGDNWINPGHEQDPIVIRLEVKGGVGEIDIDAK